MIDKSRLKNYGLWVSIAALIPLLLQGFGLDVLPDNYNAIINAILSILIMLGLINNPTTECKWFRDDENNPKCIERYKEK
ncbi:phage holin [Clostridium vincentii]|uniref:Bacteriophage holin n=1 Tax=Clostridium vincentii TaxID=52704 RepID=A0A2T0BHX0_9CLOT|nr:phage holin [Clostridium vincentii]PRR83402.1 Bacteriophage holin [Clostridium vincentii]